MRTWGNRRGVWRALAAAGATVAIGLVSNGAFASPAANSPASGMPSTTSTTLPAIPKVDPSITDGQDPHVLLANAIALSSLGIDTSALGTAIAATQAKLDADAARAQVAQRAAEEASQTATAAWRAAAAAQAAFDNTDGALKGAVTFLYTNGPSSLAVAAGAGNSIVYAQDYADSALSPYGVLANRAAAASQQRRALSSAEAAQKRADRLETTATKALAKQQSESERLQAELAAISSASAAQVMADHLALASQVGKELLSAAALQFNPKKPLPSPVATTPVALTWAFSELGKQYVWGATGPNTFDCSGLTQFVWHAAGVQLPRVAADQDAWSIPVPLSQLLPGDLVFFGRTDIHHVGIYIGDGLMINAPHTGDVVRVSSIWWSDLAGFGRVHSPGVPVPPHQPPSSSKPAAPVVVPTAGLVPSQTKPPAGWKPKPGSTTPISLNTGTSPTAPTTSTTSTTAPVAQTTTTSVVAVPTTITVVTVTPTTSTTTSVPTAP